MGRLRAQGATEYLVLLAVVLIVALVSVALLGFFPGMASDSQITQSQMYWRSASPVAILEVVASSSVNYDRVWPYIRLKNSGQYPIRITSLIGGDGNKATQFAGYSCGASNPSNISDFFYMAPGEEKYFAYSMVHGTACDWRVRAVSSGSGGNFVGGASSLCQNSTLSPGTLQLNNFGFEYIEYIEGQQITKQQIGRPLIVRCLPPY